MLKQKLSQEIPHYQGEVTITSQQYQTFIEKFNRLNSRCEKLGFPAFTYSILKTWTVDKVYEGQDQHSGNPDTYRQTYLEIRVQGEPPVLGGYEVVAKLEAHGNENMVYAYSDMPNEYRTRMECDHCKQNRYRVHTYILFDGSDYFQVGSSCLKDFLSVDPQRILQIYSHMDFLSDPDSLGSSQDWYEAKEVVALVVHWMNDMSKSFISRGATFGKDMASTSDYISKQMWPNPLMKDDLWTVTKENYTEAQKAIDYFASLPATDSDYLHNLSVIANSDIIKDKQFGLAVSMYSAYLRQLQIETRNKKHANALADEQANSSHIGAVGDKVEVTVTLEHHFSFEGAYGWIDILKFKDDSGNILVWYASNATSLVSGNLKDAYGRKFNVRATVKAHDIYKGTKQTKVIRVKEIS